MKKLLCLILTALILFGTVSVSAVDSTVSYGSEIVLGGTPVIDGKIDDVYRASFNVNITGPSTFGVQSESVAEIFVLHDSKYVYVAAEIVDTTPFKVDSDYLKDDPHPHLNDALEIRIATNGHMAPYTGTFTNHHLFYADWQGRRFSSYEQQVLGVKGKTTYEYGKSYIVEMALPLQSPLVEGEKISFNFQIDNMTIKDGKDQLGCISLRPGKDLVEFTVGGQALDMGQGGQQSDNQEEKPAPTPSLFTDVKSTDWFYEAVLTAYHNGIIKGTSANEFSPNTDVTRAMFAKILHRLDGEPTTNYEVPFKDVPQNEWYADSVKWAVKNNIINGVTETSFAPDDKVTREQIAAMIFRYINYKGKAPKNAWTATLPYKDTDSISSWAKASIMYCMSENLMTGDENRFFNPQSFATRAEVATVVNRLATFLKD
ncbi:MAG: S-layer homology domain-containing protein [Clostridia bacterium]|nr:S-layer homology domain-containing protein [Clostridia bacterium]MBQ9997674.1 S-layer homology domain-containing protein [Clostridia bacterium]